jgi:hypothetical protein
MTRPDVITGPGQLPRAHLRWIIFRSAGDLSPTLLTEETSDRFGDGRLVLDDRGNCKDPHQTAAGL